MAESGLEVVVVSGLSGAGRSTAAKCLEDLGYYVVDNLPPSLIAAMVDLGSHTSGEVTRIAVVVDVRSRAFSADLRSVIGELDERGYRPRVLYLEAADDVLVRRFEETRRRHPLANSERVIDGITRERELLGGLKGQADLVVDTSALNVHALRDRLHELFSDDAPAVASLQTSIVSFGYKHGIPVDVDLLFDCRFLPNPHWIDELRPLPGTDPRVQQYVMDQPEAKAFLDELGRLFALLLPAYVHEGKAYLSIGVGCTGGHHRSVVIADELARVLNDLGFDSRVRHRDLDRV
jgi:UPF0042 nucleotide-binding protein